MSIDLTSAGGKTCTSPVKLRGRNDCLDGVDLFRSNIGVVTGLVAISDVVFWQGLGSVGVPVHTTNGGGGEGRERGNSLSQPGR